MTIDKTTIKKILYINLAFLGDIILATPTIRALKYTYPDAEIHMFVTPWARPAAIGNPYVDQVITYDKRGEHRNITKLYELIKHLRGNHYDLAISSNFAIRGAVVAWLAGARYRLGYDARFAKAFLTHAANASRTEIKHETQNQLDILKPLDIRSDDTRLEFKLDGNDVDKVRMIYPCNSQRPRVAICPFGRHPLNSWTFSGYVALLEALLPIADCYLIGGHNEKDRLEKINQCVNRSAKILSGQLTIGQLAAFFADSDLLITVDTGPMHIGGAVGTPILALFGRSDPRVWGPRGKHDKVFRTELECVPCIIPRECSHHSCMKELSAAAVINGALEMLNCSKHRG